MQRFFLMWLVSCWLLAPLTTVAAGPLDQPGVPGDDPTIVGWATGFRDYLPADDLDDSWQVPEKSLGAATGAAADVVSLGERLVGSGQAPGEITLTFDAEIRDRTGFDLVVFENGFAAGGGLFADLAFVEVGTDGAVFARFPAISLTPGLVGDYGVIDPTDLHNLAGAHANAYGTTLGTPFDLAELADAPEVVSGEVDLQDIRFVKIVDVPGGGEYFDAATVWGYDADHPIFDSYPTFGSAGFDLDAVGVIDETAPKSDQDDDTDDDDDDTAELDDADDADDQADQGGCGGA